MKTIKTFKWKILLFASVAAGAVALILRCAVPNEPPLRWLSKIEVPMTDDSFRLAQKLPQLIASFNDTVVQYWYLPDSIPRYPNPGSSHPRYFSTVDAFDTVDTVTHLTVRWQKNHEYRLKGPNQWQDVGEITSDILMGGYDSANPGIYYTDNPDLLSDEIVKGDTVILSVRQTDSISYDVRQDSIADKYFHAAIGLLTISNAPVLSDTIPLPAGTFPPTVFNIILVKTPGGTDTIIDKLIFDASSPPISVTVRNLSAATITNLSITMLGSTQNVALLNPFDTTVLSFPVGGSGLDNANLLVQIGSTASVAGSISLDLNCNGAIATEVRAKDSLMIFQKTFTNDYDLTDTLNVNYIDIQYGFFKYFLTNYTQIPLQAQAEQLHLWITPACEQKGVDSVGAIAAAFPTAYDSFTLNYYLGKLTSGWINVDEDSTLRIITQNLSGTRLFPVWNDTLGAFHQGKSVSRVTYTVRNNVPTGALRYLKMDDSLVFVIRSPYFHFKEMLATVTQTYKRGGDTAKIDVPFPFNKDSRDSLRGKFILKQVWSDIYLYPRLPDTSAQQLKQAFLDSLNIHYTLFAPSFPATTVSKDMQFTHVVNNKTCPAPTNITPIMNEWPDSMDIVEDISVPVGTKVLAVNQQHDTDSDYDLYMGKMDIRAVTKARTNIMLGWQVLATTNLDLGVGSFKVSKSLKSFNRLENSLASLNMHVFNFSNVYMNLFGLAAPAPRMRALDNMSLDSVLLLIGDTAKAHQLGYIDLLGQRGIRIPARGQKDSSNIVLKQWETDTMLKYDSCGWRWEASFLPMTSADTLRDTDYVFIQSYVHMEGVNNMDSLLTQK
ncbi:MAG: hypothetical protein ABSF80_04945 [Chitinispirillaceae bacterium]